MRPGVVADRRAGRAAPRGRSRRAPALRAPPAPPRPRGGDGPRRRPAPGHPTPTRARPPRRHEHVGARHRHHRNHRHDPRPPPTHDPRQRRPQALTDPGRRASTAFRPSIVAGVSTGGSDEPCFDAGMHKRRSTRSKSRRRTGWDGPRFWARAVVRSRWRLSSLDPDSVGGQDLRG